MNTRWQNLVAKVSPNRVLTYSGLAFLVGVWLGEVWALPGVVGLAAAPALLFLILKKKAPTLILALVFFVYLGNYFYTDAKNSDLNSGLEGLNGRDVTATGFVVEKPEQKERSLQLVVLVDEWSTKEQSLKLPLRVLVQVERYADVEIGMHTTLRGKLSRPKDFADFSYRNYLRTQKIYLQLEKAQVKSKVLEHVPLALSIKRSLLGIGDALQQAINRSLPEPESALGSGLILGASGGFNEELSTSFKRAGLTHIVAVSGYNIAIFTSYLIALLVGFMNRRKAFWVVLILVAAFVVMAGAGASVVRAGIMGVLLLVAKNSGRKAKMDTLLVLCAAVMVALNPFILRWDVSFQLSFLATCGLVYIAPRIVSKLARVPKLAQEILATTLAAQVAVLPIMLIDFANVSLVAPLANLVVLPVIPLAMLGAFCTGLVGVLWQTGGFVLATATWPMLDFIVQSGRYFGTLPMASVSLAGINWWWGAAYYLVLAMMFLPRQKTKFKPRMW